jgi:hypothetical protein
MYPCGRGVGAACGHLIELVTPQDISAEEHLACKPLLQDPFSDITWQAVCLLASSTWMLLQSSSATSVSSSGDKRALWECRGDEVAAVDRSTLA